MRSPYPKFKILNEKEKKKIVEQLNQQFGIKKIPGIILQRGAERLFFYDGDLDKREIQDLENTIIIERIGIYFAKLIPGEDQIRLSIEGSHILKDQITKNIFTLNDKQAEKYLKGEEVEIKIPEKERGFVVIKYKEDLWGCGKASAEKISNFIPKARRVKEK